MILAPGVSVARERGGCVDSILFGCRNMLAV